MSKKPKPGRTVNPLHFEDLDPHRFEDLVRQLVYEFRDWTDIQGVGRTGNDQGFDAIAYERAWADFDDEAGDDEVPPPWRKRLWSIQCKRQRAFGPTDAKRVVGEVRPQVDEQVHGMIVAVPADISLATRRAFAVAAREAGFEEFYIWGRAELEDQLYLPRNDHLLFAYFGVSLQIRRRTLKAEFRAELTLKKQLVRVLGDVNGDHHTEVLIRPPFDDRYPYVEDRAKFLEERPWWYCRFVEHWPPHALLFELRQVPAYLDRHSGAWDAIFDYDLRERRHNDLWGLEPSRGSDEWAEKWKADQLEEARYLRYYEEIPEEQQGHISILGLIPYERIVAIDEIGDRLNRGPHLIVEKNAKGKFFDPSPFHLVIRQFGRMYSSPVLAREEKRIEKFPREFPTLSAQEFEEVEAQRAARREVRLRSITERQNRSS